MRRCAVALLTLALTATASAEPDALETGRYLSKYPGLTVTATISHDPRDEVFDEHGHRVDGVTPAYGDGNRFPQTRGTLDFDWHLPLFETEALPFVSSRLWNARAQVGYAETSTHGPIRDVADAGGGPTSKSGVTDVELAFGPVLYGSADWRTRSATPLSVLLLAEVRLPVGARDAASPNNVGDNTWAYGARLGTHWQPQGFLAGFLLDAGVRYRVYGSEQEPVFGAQAPTQQGADFDLDATLARKLWRGLYAQVSYFRRQGADNEYRNVRFTANAPPPDPGMDTFPDPSAQQDRGTREQRLQFGVGGFITQSVWVGAQYAVRLSGRSGGFDQPYLEQMQNCQATNTCMPANNGSDHVDGLGPARSYASDYYLVSVRWTPGASRSLP